MMFARTRRAICGMYMKPIEKMIAGTDLPRMVTRTAARAMPGTDMMMSRMRMMTSDTHLRETAATAPMMEPVTSANSVAPKPMTSEMRPPYNMRDRMSRPLSSVPKMCAPVGAWRAMSIA